MSRLNCAYFTISNSPGTSGALTVSAAVDSTVRTLGSAQNGQVFDARIFETGVGFEIRTGCTYTHSGTSLSRGTLEDSSTGSALNFTSAAKVMVVETAATFAALDLQLSRGSVIVRNDGTTTTSISASTFTKISAINSEEYDPLGWWDNSTTRFQPTRVGRYLCMMGIQVNQAMASIGNVSSVIASLRKNGADFAHVARGWVYQDVGIAAKNVGVSGSAIIYLNGSSDYVEPFGWQNDTSARSTVAGAERQFFMATYLGDS
jgi:hypothetical protein